VISTRTRKLRAKSLDLLPFCAFYYHAARFAEASLGADAFWLVLGIPSMLKLLPFIALVVLAWPAAVGAQDRASVNDLIRDLRDVNDKQRLAAARNLAERGPAAAPAVPALISALSDQSEKVRFSALQALQRIGRGAREAIPALLEILKGDDPSLFGGAIDALGAIGVADEDAKEDLLGFMLGEDERLSVAACRALLRILPHDDEDRPKTIPVLIEALHAREASLRDEAVAALGLAGPIAIPDLIKLVDGHVADPESASRAAAALAQMGPNAEPAVTALVHALQSGREPVIVPAAAALSSIGPAAEPAVSQLAKMLSAKRPMIRIAALRALGDIGPASAAAVGDMSAALADKDENIRRESALALGKIGPEAKSGIPALIAALSDKSELVKGQAVWAMSRIGANAVPPLIALLEDDKLQDTAVVCLGNIGAAARPAVPSLVKLLSQSEMPTDLGREILLTLSRIGPAAAESVPALLKILSDEQSELRPYAAWAIAQIGFKPAIPLLIRALPADEDSNPSELSIVLPLAVLTLNPESVPRNEVYITWAKKRGVALLEHPSSLVRQAAAAALASIGERAALAVPQLAVGVEDADPEVRGACLSTLAAIGPDAAEALPAIIRALADPVHAVRYSASYAVGKIGPAAKVTAPLLVQNLQDQDPLLRFTSAWALLMVDPQRSNLASLCTEPFRWGLKYADAHVRREAAQALGSLGPDAASAVPDLEALAKDADEIVHQAANEALQKISQTKPNSRGFFERLRGVRNSP
jgi:HEAT repeat protein